MAVSNGDRHLHKEVIMAHSAYARAAGLQSEVNKITVTRVAGNEMEYKRQLNVYKKDMMLTINNIRREQKQLRKSIYRYRRKMRQNKIDKRKRDKEAEEMDSRANQNIINVFDLSNRNDTSSFQNNDSVTDIQEQTMESPRSHEDGIRLDEHDQAESSKVSNEMKNDQREEVQKKRLSETTPRLLPSIFEDNEEKDSICGKEETDNGLLSLPAISDHSSSSSPNILSKKLKPRKQAVNFSDIIKLQHTTNTKKLFSMVHILAEKSGIKDEENLTEKERRNNASARGATDNAMSESLMRTAKIFYPINFGYTSDNNTNDTVDHRSDFTVESVEQSSTDRKSGTKSNASNLNSSSSQLSDVSSSKRAEERSASQRRRHTRKMKSMPSLLDDVAKIHDRKLTDVDSSRPSYEASRSLGSTPRFLSPIEKRVSSVSLFSNESDSVPWTKAFGLLKAVHNLNDSFI